MTVGQKHKHLTAEQRVEIQECLSHGMDFKAIGRRIGKDQTTVSKEVKKHTVRITTSVEHFNPKTHERIFTTCPKLLKAPFVCNPCGLCNRVCSYDKLKYIGLKAEEDYRKLLIDSREGVNFNDEDFYEMDRVITDGVNKGQHVYQIIQTNDFNYRKSAIYDHIRRGNLSVSASQLPRMVKFKKRKANYQEYIPVGLKIGRTYADYCVFTEQNPALPCAEMDTVIGRIGGKCILTFLFNFMFGLLVGNKSSAEVSKTIIALKLRLRDSGFAFGKLFAVILTDNGGEFADVFTLEKGLDGSKETSLYFCNPHHSWEKPRVEKNHTLFRDIAPSGTSFDDWTQSHVDIIFSHVNAAAREAFGGKSPYDLFTFVHGQAAADALGVRRVDPVDVVQTPLLLKALGAC